MTRERDDLAKYIAPGERLIWSGRPQHGIVFRTIDAYFIPATCLWLALAIAWTVGVSIEVRVPAFQVVGSLGTLYGCYILFGRFFADAFFRSRTTYAITSSRIIVVGSLSGSSVKTFPLPRSSEVEVIPVTDGRATVRFGAVLPFGWYATSWGYPEFFRISDSEAAVEALVGHGGDR